MEETFTLQELAERHGQLSNSAVSCDQSVFSGNHNYAGILHGWFKYQRKAGPVELTDDQYTKALDASRKGKVFDGAVFRVDEAK